MADNQTPWTPEPFVIDGIAIQSERTGEPLCLMGEPAQYAGDTATMCVNSAANARLFCAAPDLAGSTSKLATFPLTESEEARDDDFILYAREGSWTLTVGDVKAARAALSKAKGEV